MTLIIQMPFCKKIAGSSSGSAFQLGYIQREQSKESKQ
jgi:hypothetical protein